ncbi:hypothetical protein [Nocardioides sp.]|uniref:hypothetical protein n=1 Tax=Nocardioides sp. TaxID=35761 RepID=UPI003783525C
MGARTRSVAVLVAGLVAMVGILTPAPALADGPKEGSYSRHFSATKMRYFKTLHRCLVVSVSGTYKFRIEYDTRWSAFYRDRRVVHPAFTLRSYPKCITGPQMYKPVHKMELTQSWSSSTCSTDVGISVSAPWGVGVSASQSCDRSRLAYRKTEYVGRSGSRTQYNSTTVVHYDNEYLKPLAWGHAYGGPSEVKAPLCFKVDGDVVVYPTKRGDSDSWESKLKPCVRWW